MGLGVDRKKGFTEVIVGLQFGETVGETRFLEELLQRRRLDLSTSAGQEFLERFVVGQLKASLRLAREIDDLKAELHKVRLALAERP